LDQLENNIKTDLYYALELPFAKIKSFNIDQENHFYIERPKTELTLVYLIDQMDQRPNAIMLGELEKHMSIVCHQISTVFLSRQFEQSEIGLKSVTYKLQVKDYDVFLSGLEEIGRRRYNEQFTKALEAKLSES